LAHDPLAGQGIRFALASAFAAASVIQTWADKGDREAARCFYRSFVAQARIRHLEFLEQRELDAAAGNPPLLPERVRFSGRSGLAELSVDSHIVRGRAILLDGPTAVRWLGGVDLLQLQKLARKPIASAALLGEIAATGVESGRASAILSWCLRKGVLTSAVTKMRQ
jgi:flavin-dependent dehydrogenase